MGSSPLARGLLRSSWRSPARDRIIPARAGFTPRPVLRSGMSRDHPRSRGVYCAWCSMLASRGGSSPLARGLPTCQVPIWAPNGIIPARAGFTSWPPRPRSSWADHPRSRGVYPLTFSQTTTCGGSSPLARGLLTLLETPVRPDRIIPARAGFTPPVRVNSQPKTDHPRSRGVYSRCTGMTLLCAGSSPLARGLRLHHVLQRREARIIPARAGFTSILSSPQMPSWDHPRSRGVYPATSRMGTYKYGSSPLARGLRKVDH